jgi:hypothetical protein
LAKNEWSKALPIVQGLLILISRFWRWAYVFLIILHTVIAAPACALGKLLQNKSSLETNYGASIQSRDHAGGNPKAKRIGRQQLFAIQPEETHERETSGNDIDRLRRVNGKGPRSGTELQTQVAEADLDIREGRFQRWLALIAGASSALSGIEVTYEHYKGSYGRRIMYTPVILSGALTGGGDSRFF